MALPVKLLISSKKNLEKKYGSDFSTVLGLLTNLVNSDKGKNLDTRIVFIDDKASAKQAGIKNVASVTPKACKTAVDELYKVNQPAYMVLVGAQDVFPFQSIKNPVSDSDDPDKTVPSDLSYACDTPYGTKISAFTGPTRVVGRIPDVPGSAKISYLKTVINNIIKHKPVDSGKYMSYFAITASVWEKSTQLNLQAMFSNCTNLLNCPPANGSYSKTQLKPLMHFYNCHGGLVDASFYGQIEQDYPVAIESSELNKKVSYGTVIAAECCYGAQLFDPSDVSPKSLSIANNYFQNKAIAFGGSSTVAYGEFESLANADLMTQYFIRSILNGASTGRAMLEARQKFLTNNGPQLDPYELKTLAQYYLLGDPSIQPVASVISKQKGMVQGNTIENRRLNMFNKGINLKKTVEPSEVVQLPSLPKHSTELKKLFKQTAFSGKEKQTVYAIKSKSPGASGMAKTAPAQNVRYRSFVKPAKKSVHNHFQVLVIKELNEQLLGWKIYASK